MIDLHWLRKLLPHSIAYRLGDLRARLADRRYSGMTIQEVFSDIYRRNAWGGGDGQAYSGDGSSHQAIAGPNVAAVVRILGALPKEGRKVIDLGCGDFQVGNG